MAQPVLPCPKCDKVHKSWQELAQHYELKHHKRVLGIFNGNTDKEDHFLAIFRDNANIEMEKISEAKRLKAKAKEKNKRRPCKKNGHEYFGLRRLSDEETNFALAANDKLVRRTRKGLTSHAEVPVGTLAQIHIKQSSRGNN